MLCTDSAYKVKAKSSAKKEKKEKKEEKEEKKEKKEKKAKKDKGKGKAEEPESNGKRTEDVQPQARGCEVTAFEKQCSMLSPYYTGLPPLM